MSLPVRGRRGQAGHLQKADSRQTCGPRSWACLHGPCVRGTGEAGRPAPVLSLRRGAGSERPDQEAVGLQDGPGFRRSPGLGGREAVGTGGPALRTDATKVVGCLGREASGPRAMAGPGLHPLLRLQGWDGACRRRSQGAWVEQLIWSPA